MKSLLALLQVALLCGACRSQELPLEERFAETQVPDHMQVMLHLPAKVMIGEKIPAQLVIENIATKAFEITVGGDYRSTGYPQRIKVRVRDAADQILPELPREAYGIGGGLTQNVSVEPGHSTKIEFPLECYVNFTKPGFYTVIASHDLGWKLDPAHDHPLGVASLSVTEPTAAQAAALVAKIFDAHAATSASDESENRQRIYALERSLSVLRHPAYLAPLMERAQSGEVTAVVGLGHMATPQATEALIALLHHRSSDVVREALQRLRDRIPSREDSSKPALPAWFVSSVKIDPLLPTTWESSFEAPMMRSAARLLTHEEPDVVAAAAVLIQARVTAEHAPALIKALQKSLDTPHPVQSGPKANTLDPPGAQRSLLAALDALTKTGWRAPSSGGTASMVAWFRQLADESIPKPPDGDWQTSMLTWVTNGPVLLKICALQALPLPLSDDAAREVQKALEDPDWSVMRVACEIAGESKRSEFITPLAQIIETAHESFVHYAARDAALACGARLELWEALAASILAKDRMYDAISALIAGTIDLNPSGSGGGSSNFTREQRFAIRDAWLAFLQQHAEPLAAGLKVAPPDAATAAALTGTNFDPASPAAEVTLEDGSRWPPRQE